MQQLLGVMKRSQSRNALSQQGKKNIPILRYHSISPYRATWRYFCSRCYSEDFSKAVVSSYVGARESFSAELFYTFHILPKAIVRGRIEGLFQFDLAGFLRAGAIMAGLVITVAGYAVGAFSLRLSLFEVKRGFGQARLSDFTDGRRECI